MADEHEVPGDASASTGGAAEEAPGTPVRVPDSGAGEAVVGAGLEGAEARRAAVGARLRRARLEAGLTQDQLASRVGRKKNWLSDIERGRRGIDVHTLQRVASLTGHSIEFFTNPEFSQKRREEMLRPVTREDWDLIYADEPERAAAHASLDAAFRRARQTLAEGDAGATGE